MQNQSAVQLLLHLLIILSFKKYLKAQDNFLDY